MSDVKIGIVGAGTMGVQIASLFGFCGYDVCIFDSMPPEDFTKRVSKVLRFLKRNEAMRAFTAGTEGLVELASKIDEIGDASLIIECVSEDIDIKKAVLAQIDGICRPDAILATNTSSLSTVELSAFTTRPQYFMGIHFFNPVYSVPLVELTQTPSTEEPHVNTVCEILKHLGRVVVPVKDSPGFIVNRLLFLLIAAAARMVDENVAAPAQIDLAMKTGANFPMGPLEIADIIGLDVCESILNNLYSRTGDAVYAVPESLAKRVSEGQLGRKVGAGFYQRK